MRSRRVEIAALGLLAASVSLALVALAVPASAGVPATVSVEDDFFDPDPVAQGVTLSVTWDWADGLVNEHNVRQDDKLFRSGNPTDIPTESFEIHPSAGTYHYYCELHGSEAGGMDGKLRMRPIQDFLKRGSTRRIIWSDGSNDSGNQFDVQYRVQGRDKWRNWKKNTKQDAADFGGNDKPIDVNPNKTYEVRARSEKASNPKKKRSGWSPPLPIEFT
jgi:plastocyanin